MVAANREQGLPADPSRNGGELQAVSRFGARVAALAAVPLAIALGLFALEDAFELGSGLLIVSLAAGLILVVGLLAFGLHDLRAAEARTREAVDRAMAAEIAQRSRADELARVLKAAESLALTGAGQVDYLSVLEAITPDGATSFLVCVDGEAEAAVVAAHGPLAASVVGIRRPISPPGAGLGEPASVTSFSVSGRTVGVAVPREHLGGAELEIEAGLTIRVVDHGGRSLGSLHLLDHRGERILEPSFVSLAQLVANQIGVAIENNALLARVPPPARRGPASPTAAYPGLQARRGRRTCRGRRPRGEQSPDRDPRLCRVAHGRVVRGRRASR